jgi:ABC-type sugar transport system permease subunit
LIGIVRVNFSPLAYALIISFQENKISSRETPWVGLANYRTLVTDPSLFIIPWAIPAFVAALIWAWMFNRYQDAIDRELEAP